MFCPQCKDEFRQGFTRCARCEVDLVEDLSAGNESPSTPAPPVPLHFVELCGFFGLDDARAARDQLRARSMRSEIVVREAPDADLGAPASEEYWLRVDASRFREATRIVGEEPAAPEAEPEMLACSDCGKAVASEESFCPHCGARFEA